jgi:hypothetical protein
MIKHGDYDRVTSQATFSGDGKIVLLKEGFEDHDERAEGRYIAKIPLNDFNNLKSIYLIKGYIDINSSVSVHEFDDGDLY